MGVGGECRTGGGEMLPMLVVGWQASAVRGEEAGHFHEVVGVSIIVAGGPRFMTNSLPLDSRVA